MKKVLPIFLILLGLALLLGAATFWYDRLTVAEPASLAQNLRDWLTALFGLGASLKGWLELFKKDDQPPPADPATRGDHAPIHNGEGDIVRVEAETVSGGVVAGKIGHLEYHEAPEPEKPPDTIGFIPPASAETYIPRGEIEESLLARLRRGESGAIVGVSGVGGIGKTEMAKELARRLQADYETLWVEVGEKDAAQTRAAILLALGIAPPEGEARQNAALRHAYARRRLLLVLDDLRRPTLEGLRALLPPPPSAALLTSRVRQLPGVHTEALDILSEAQARALLESILGRETVAAEAQTAADLMERCGYHPLALEIAARRIRQMQGVKQPVARFFALAREHFEELRLPDAPRWDLTQVFDLSYRDVSAADRRRFRQLAAFHSSGFALEAAAFLWEMGESAARAVLSRFVNLSLVQAAPGAAEAGERYRLHGLLDEYAAAKLAAAPQEAAAARRRAAGWLIALFEAHYTDDPSTAPRVAAEMENLRAACAWAQAAGEGETLARLATKARNWLQIWSLWEEWQAWLDAALRLGIRDKGLRANVLQAIGDVQQFRDDRDAALQSYQRALALFREIGDRLGEANVLAALSRLEVAAGRVEAAERQLEDVLRLRREIHDRYDEGADLGNFAIALLNAGHPQKALGYAQRARAVFAEIGIEHLVDMMERVAAACEQAASGGQGQ